MAIGTPGGLGTSATNLIIDGGDVGMLVSGDEVVVSGVSLEGASVGVAVKLATDVMLDTVRISGYVPPSGTPYPNPGLYVADSTDVIAEGVDLDSFPSGVVIDASDDVTISSSTVEASLPPGTGSTGWSGVGLAARHSRNVTIHGTAIEIDDSILEAVAVRGAPVTQGWSTCSNVSLSGVDVTAAPTNAGFGIAVLVETCRSFTIRGLGDGPGVVEDACSEVAASGQPSTLSGQVLFHEVHDAAVQNAVLDTSNPQLFGLYAVNGSSLRVGPHVVIGSPAPGVGQHRYGLTAIDTESVRACQVTVRGADLPGASGLPATTLPLSPSLGTAPWLGAYGVAQVGILVGAVASSVVDAANPAGPPKKPFSLEVIDSEISGNAIGLLMAGLPQAQVIDSVVRVSRLAGIAALATSSAAPNFPLIAPAREHRLKDVRVFGNGVGVITDQWASGTFIGPEAALPPIPLVPPAVPPLATDAPTSQIFDNAFAAVRLGGVRERVVGARIGGPPAAMPGVPDGLSADGIGLAHVPAFLDLVPAGLAVTRLADIGYNRVTGAPRGVLLHGAFNSRVHHNAISDCGAGVFLAPAVSPIHQPGLKTLGDLGIVEGIDVLSRTVDPVENQIDRNTIDRRCHLEESDASGAVVGLQDSLCPAIAYLGRTTCRGEVCLDPCRADGGACACDGACEDLAGDPCTCGEPGCPLQECTCGAKSCICEVGTSQCECELAGACWNGMAPPGTHRVEAGDNPFHHNDIRQCDDGTLDCLADPRPFPTAFEPTTFAEAAMTEPVYQSLLSGPAAINRPAAPHQPVAACALSVHVGRRVGFAYFPGRLPGRVQVWEECNRFHGFDGSPEYPSLWLFDTRDVIPEHDVDCASPNVSQTPQDGRVGNVWNHRHEEPGTGVTADDPAGLPAYAPHPASCGITEASLDASLDTAPGARCLAYTRPTSLYWNGFRMSNGARIVDCFPFTELPQSLPSPAGDPTCVQVGVDTQWLVGDSGTYMSGYPNVRSLYTREADALNLANAGVVPGDLGLGVMNPEVACHLLRHDAAELSVWDVDYPDMTHDWRMDEQEVALSCYGGELDLLQVPQVTPTCPPTAEAYSYCQKAPPAGGELLPVTLTRGEATPERCTLCPRSVPAATDTAPDVVAVTRRLRPLQHLLSLSLDEDQSPDAGTDPKPRAGLVTHGSQLSPRARAAWNDARFEVGQGFPELAYSYQDGLLFVYQPANQRIYQFVGHGKVPAPILPITALDPANVNVSKMVTSTFIDLELPKGYTVRDMTWSRQHAKLYLLVKATNGIVDAAGNPIAGTSYDVLWVRPPESGSTKAAWGSVSGYTVGVGDPWVNAYGMAGTGCPANPRALFLGDPVALYAARDGNLYVSDNATEPETGACGTATVKRLRLWQNLSGINSNSAVTAVGACLQPIASAPANAMPPEIFAYGFDRLGPGLSEAYRSFSHGGGGPTSFGVPLHDGSQLSAILVTGVATIFGPKSGVWALERSTEHCTWCPGARTAWSLGPLDDPDGPEGPEVAPIQGQSLTPASTVELNQCPESLGGGLIQNAAPDIVLVHFTMRMSASSSPLSDPEVPAACGVTAQQVGATPGVAASTLGKLTTVY